MWTGDGKTCNGKIENIVSRTYSNFSDVNECETNNQCHENATCINEEPGYTCECDKGYQGNGYFCSDIDECLTDDICGNSDAGACENTEGSYLCNCKNGFELIDGKCEDVDECTSTNICGDSVCFNSIGSYKCENPIDTRIVSYLIAAVHHIKVTLPLPNLLTLTVITKLVIIC